MNDDIRPSGKHTKPFSRNTIDNVFRAPAGPASPEAKLEQPAEKPQQVDFTIDEAQPDQTESNSVVTPPVKRSLLSRLKLGRPSTKKALLGVIAALVVITLAVYMVFLKPQAKAVVPKHVAATVHKPISNLVPSTLSGLPVNPSLNKVPVTGVMIENSLPARPQAGLSQAGVVFEALAEGGITRFLALYQDQAPANIGPIRSVRPYYLQWDLGFDAAIAHVGGSPAGLNDIKAWGAKDLNQFYYASAYHRISTRAAPHNMYSSIANLNNVETSKGYTSTNFTGFSRKADQPSPHPTAANIVFNPSYADYRVNYTYSPATNSYNRSEGGVPMVDSNTNKQISPKVVIALIVPFSQGPLDSTGAYYSDYQVIGSGQAYVFQDGNVTTGQWSKSSNASQIIFKQSNGQTLTLNAGQTWITALASPNQLSYTP